MAKASEIINQLVTYLPLYSSLFSTNVNLAPLTRSGSTVTGQTIAVAVSSITRASTTATVTTATAHGLTTGDIVTIAGATPSAYNGDFSVTATSSTVFTYAIAGSPVTPATGTITVSPPHGLSTNNYINIKGAEAPVVISALTQTGNVATAVTATDHDLTEGYQSTVFIAGAEQAEYNGTKTLLTVPNRRTFTFEISGDPVSPATTLDVLLAYDAKERGYNGRYQITKVNASKFNYATTGAPYSPCIGSPVAQSGIRITGAVSADRAAAAYTAQNPDKYWAFVVLGDTTISKDRHILSDASAVVGAGSSLQQLEIQGFSVFVFAPATTEIAARATRDQMEDVRISLYKSLLTKRFGSELSSVQTMGVTAAGHQFLDYNTAYYVHQFNFTITQYITYDDAFNPDENVAFRDVYLTLNNSPDEPATAEVDLDDVPL